MLCFVAKTNKEYCMINTLVTTMPDGRRYVFDRDTTEYFIEDDGDLFMDDAYNELVSDGVVEDFLKEEK